MRKGILLAMILCMGSIGQAQTWDEWFRQKKTRRKYLVEQIVALKVYLGYAEKGYRIASEGLTTIGRIKRGDWSLHDNYFTSLKAVSPTVKKSPKAAAVVTAGLQIVNQVTRAKAEVRLAGWSSLDEQEANDNVLDNLLMACLKTINELTNVLTTGELAMKDDERLKRMERLNNDMLEHYTFCVDYLATLRLYLLQRQSETIDINYSKKLNDAK